MKSEKFKRHVVWAFLAALLAYIALFQGIEHMRTRKGPWIVKFTLEKSGAPAVVISHPVLDLSDVKLVFPGESVSATNLPATIQFDKPHSSLPFGKVVFQDTTFQPGAVTLDLFGHEIELLPRVLYLNRQERPWASGSTHALLPEEKLSDEARRPEPKKKKR